MISSDKNSIGLRSQKEDLYSMSLAGRRHGFNARISEFQGFIDALGQQRELSYFRQIHSPMDRLVRASQRGEAPREVLMFGSNNYLGFANDAYIRQKVKESIDRDGVGVAGPPILNGYSRQHRLLEERLADFKNSEDAIIFPSGYQTNLGLIGGLLGKRDPFFIDGSSHASTIDAIRLAGFRIETFRHNSYSDLRNLIINERRDGQLFVGVEGLYSMDGDLCPLDHFLKVINENDGICLLDDAHGTGIMGNKGKGAIEYFDFPPAEILHIGTFSKTFGVNGGFIAGSKPLITYIRYHARSYMFSASLANSSVAAVHAGLDLIEREPWRRKKLRELTRYVKKAFERFDLIAEPVAAIVAVRVPPGVDVRKACTALFELGFFVNAVEYPAIQRGSERFRISLMAYHEKEDIDRLADALEHVFEKYRSF